MIFYTWLVPCGRACCGMKKQERTVLVYEQIQFYRNRDPRRDHHRTYGVRRQPGLFYGDLSGGGIRCRGHSGPFVQDNQSKSTRGVLRGLHFQKEHTQGKLVRVVSGEVFDVAVDCRPNSETFGKWVGVTLSAENKKQFYIPQGFAHGFLVLSEEAEFTYKCTDYYDPAAEGGVKWDDPDVGIVWPAVDGEIRLSAKDGEHRGFKEQTYEFFERW